MMQRVYLKGQMKKAFIYDGQSLNNRYGCLYLVEIDVRQLHFLDLVHNDINLSNILFDEDIDEAKSVIMLELQPCLPTAH